MLLPRHNCRLCPTTANVLLLDLVRGQRQRAGVRRLCFLSAAEPSQQVSARSVKEIIVVQLYDAPAASISRKPCSHPSLMATAAAWFSATMGDGLIRFSSA